MRRLLAPLLFVVLAAPASAVAARGTSTVSPWIALDLQQISSHSVNPPRAARGLALVSVAMFRAERAASARNDRAAIAGAAETVLIYLFPDRTELHEVYDISRSLTADQKRIADFWADGAGTITPPGHWNNIAAALVRSRRLSTPRAARLFAALNTAQADAFICAWDAKYSYWSL